jgi:hypothetical protein
VVLAIGYVYGYAHGLVNGLRLAPILAARLYVYLYFTNVKMEKLICLS